MPGLKLEPVDDGVPANDIQGDRATIGRTAGVDHIVNDPSVSRQHAVFERHGGSWTVTDNGSANGTFLDRRKITTAEIHDGQEIQFGLKAFRVRIEWADMPTALVPMDALPPPAPPMITPPPMPVREVPPSRPTWFPKSQDDPTPAHGPPRSAHAFRGPPLLLLSDLI